MAKLPAPVSPSELTILKILWRSGPMSVRDVCDALEAEKQQWAYTTVQTLLNRLVAKGVVQRDAVGHAHQYRPAVTRKRMLASRLNELADQLCDGAASPLLAALVDAHRFTADELQGFRKLLDAQADDKPKKGAKKQR